MRSVLLASLSALLLPVIHTEAAARFNGSSGYQFVNNMASLAISTGMIDNSAGKASTGTLQVKLWATKSLYKGGSISGHLLASYKLEPLKAGQFYRDVRKVVAYTPPPVKGTYYITLTLSEYTGSGYAIVDCRNMKNTAALGPLKTFTISAPWRWQTNYVSNTMVIEAAKISHRRPGHTGTLKVSVWVTDTPYRGGNLEGHQIGFVTKEALESGYSYSNLKTTAKFSPPPDGTYFMSLVLSEFDDGAYRVVDYITSTEAATFKKPAP